MEISNRKELCKFMMERNSWFDAKKYHSHSLITGQITFRNDYDTFKVWEIEIMFTSGPWYTTTQDEELVKKLLKKNFFTQLKGKIIENLRKFNRYFR